MSIGDRARWFNFAGMARHGDSSVASTHICEAIVMLLAITIILLSTIAIFRGNNDDLSGNNCYIIIVNKGDNGIVIAI